MSSSSHADTTRNGDWWELTNTGTAANGYTITDGTVSGIAVDERDTRITVKNAAGAIAAGPCGEGVAAGVSVSDTEVFALADPSPGADPDGDGREFLRAVAP